jgi:L-ribulose-5-phosphate 4-epimerase
MSYRDIKDECYEANLLLPALKTAQLNRRVQPISKDLLDKHFLRKHGSGAYYGQG